MTTERGSTTVVMAAVVGLIAAIAVATSALGVLYAARTQAQTAADAAALAAAVATYPPAATLSPVRAARKAADANGADLVRCHCHVDSGLSVRTVLVQTAILTEVPIFGVVTVGARSRAEFDPLRWLGF